MMELRQIVRLWQQGAASVLVTLVRAEGSSYRRPGAHLLLGSGGDYAGTISGGCLETEVIRKASWLVRDGALIERYSTMFDDTADVPFGLGCGGVVDLLLEPTDTPECRALISALESAITGEEATVLTWLPNESARLQRAVIDAAGDFTFASEGLSEIELVQARRRVLAKDDSLSASDSIFIDRIMSPQRLFVLGAGDDAKPLVSMASLLGWSVTVLDGRPQSARRDRFPEAERVVVATAASSELRQIRPNDAVVLMTHSYEQDRDLLAAVLPLRPRYLGLLGSPSQLSSRQRGRLIALMVRGRMLRSNLRSSRP
jgi:xanthine dehydrogenase accessory factor